MVILKKKVSTTYIFSLYIYICIHITISEMIINNEILKIDFHQDSPDKKIDDKNKKEEKKKEKSPKKLDSKGEITKS